MNIQDEMNIGELEKLVHKRDEAEDMLTMSLDLLKREVDKQPKKEVRMGQIEKELFPGGMNIMLRIHISTPTVGGIVGYVDENK